MPKFATVVSVGFLVIVAVSGCGSASPEAPGTTVVTAPEQDDAGTPPEDQTERQDRTGQQWAMPDLVGSTVQDAQDRIQSLTGGAVFYTSSHDLTGEDRNQVLDSNWKVCTQNVAPGAPLTTASRVDFGAVKLDENCP